MVKLNLDQDLDDDFDSDLRELLSDDPLTLQLVLNLIALNHGMNYMLDKLEEHDKRLIPHRKDNETWQLDYASQNWSHWRRENTAPAWYRSGTTCKWNGTAQSLAIAQSIARGMSSENIASSQRKHEPRTGTQNPGVGTAGLCTEEKK